MTASFTPEQEARVREIVAEMLSTALRGADQRIAELVSGSVVLLPLHSMADKALAEPQSFGNVERFSGLDLSTGPDLSDERWLQWRDGRWEPQS